MVSSKNRYKPRLYLQPLTSLPKEYSFLSKDSQVLNYKSIFPFFQFKFTNPNSSWVKFCNKIKELELCGKCTELHPDEIIPFLDANSHIEFEMDMFADSIPEIIYFKYLGNIHAYGLEQISKTKILVRFFFDVKEFIG